MRLHAVLYSALTGSTPSLSEIRQLDSERQSLVYNHHHELIAASDTISAVSSYISKSNIID